MGGRAVNSRAPPWPQGMPVTNQTAHQLRCRRRSCCASPAPPATEEVAANFWVRDFPPTILCFTSSKWGGRPLPAPFVGAAVSAQRQVRRKGYASTRRVGIPGEVELVQALVSADQRGWAVQVWFDRSAHRQGAPAARTWCRSRARPAAGLQGRSSAVLTARLQQERFSTASNMSAPVHPRRRPARPVPAARPPRRFLPGIFIAP